MGLSENSEIDLNRVYASSSKSTGESSSSHNFHF